MKIRRILAVAALVTTALFTAPAGRPFHPGRKELVSGDPDPVAGRFLRRLRAHAARARDVRRARIRQADGAIIAILSQNGVQKGQTRAFAAPGSNQILIGLLLPAVQKVREAAAPPAGAAD